jgi:hypothetical protein
MKIASIFLLFTVVKVFAQTPVIDSLLINESKGVLSVYGKFGVLQGITTCDGVQLPIISWSDSLISATIPDTGIGSHGPVVVDVNGQESDEQMISFWEGRVYNDYYSSVGTSSLSFGGELLFTLRMDLQSIVKSNSTWVRIFDPMKSTSYHTYHYYNTPYVSGKGSGYRYSYNSILPLYYDSIYTQGMRSKVLFYPDWTVFNVQVGDIRGVLAKEIYLSDQTPRFVDTTVEAKVENFYTYLYLDSLYQILKDSVDDGYNFTDIHVRSGVGYHLPQNTIAIKYQPTIIGPLNGSTDQGTNTVVLRWNRIPYTTNYQVQVSLDTFINSTYSGQTQQSQIFLDTIVTTTEVLLPPLEKTTKYFWRVRGIYEDVEGGWSVVPNFTTGVNADVDEEALAPSIVLYPNPAQQRAILRFTLAKNSYVACSLHDILGKEVWSMSEHQFSGGIHEIVCGLEYVPAGQYLFRLSAEGRTATVAFIKQ